MTRTVTVVEVWEKREGEWHKTVWTMDELRLVYPQKRHKPRTSRSHAMKVLRKRGLTV